MKHSLFFIAPLTVFCGCDSGPAHVIVKSLKEPLPTAANWEANYEKFSEYVGQYEDDAWRQEQARTQLLHTKSWKNNYGKYTQALLARAAEAHLDSQSLSNVMGTILADGQSQHLAYVPFVACSTTYNGQPAWVVDISWEVDSSVDETLGHIRSYAIVVRDQKEVGFTTCR